MTRDDGSDGAETEGKNAVKPGGTTATGRGSRAEFTTYECVNCGHRTRGRTGPGDCSDCGGEMKNLGVASEQ
ncbi:rubrerythrin-like domain-containing protein [Halobium palmae]|uniref:Rubrerythrin-like domain-containing protein n=1 Tax=Halobium palmae TaxID=1776492 RepID=A0ABD5S1L0_9EURY